MTGLKEDGDQDDNAKIAEILGAIECNAVQPAKIVRLGKKIENSTRCRPVLIVTDSVSTKKKILANKSKLRNVNDDYKSVYMKADEPLCVQNESKRLKDFLKKEKLAPTNVGCNIRIDYKKRELLRDDQVIDRFVSPFRKGGPNH